MNGLEEDVALHDCKDSLFLNTLIAWSPFGQLLGLVEAAKQRVGVVALVHTCSDGTAPTRGGRCEQEGQ